MPYPIAQPWIDATDLSAVEETVASGWLGTGPSVANFERSVGETVGARHVIATSSGTAALHLALLASGVGPGDEVILPSLTYAATAQAITACGATPVFADVRPDTLCLDPDDAERRLTSRTRAIVPVYYAGDGRSAPTMLELARANRVALVEDAAHAFGSVSSAGPIGTGPGLTCFSFGPIKPLTCGQGGAVALDDPDLAQQIARTADLGIDRNRTDLPVVSAGLRYRMMDLNAALGLSQLSRLDEITRRRRRLWLHYRDSLRDVAGVDVPAHEPEAMLPFMFVIRIRADIRDAVRNAMSATGISTGIHYRPLHCEPLFSGEGLVLPATEAAGAELVTLPFHSAMSIAQVDQVVSALDAAVAAQPIESA